MFHSHLHHQSWEEENIPEFNELFLSWNGKRPQEGNYHFYVTIKLEEWSPELLYASWGQGGQSTFAKEESFVRTYQDVVEVLQQRKATGFRIRVADDEGNSIDAQISLHVYTNGEVLERKSTTVSFSSIFLDVPGLSQIALDHPRSLSLCSPTSTCAVVRYLSKNFQLDPLQFAHSSRDEGFDIFGNWVLNVAQASHELGPSWSVWVQRLTNFDDIYERLSQNAPVIVSVRGPLEGSARPYNQGHLLAVIGYDAEKKQVLCMDPAFSKDQETHVRYSLLSFLEAWNRRGNIAYIFTGN